MINGGLQNTAFMENDEGSTVCWSFSEKPRRKLSQNRKTTIHELQKIMDKEAPLNVRNFKTGVVLFVQ